jgi:hypothetical protein
MALILQAMGIGGPHIDEGFPAMVFSSGDPFKETDTG